MRTTCSTTRMSRPSLCHHVPVAFFCLLSDTKTAAIDFASHKLPVIAVLLYPGIVETDLTRPFIQQISADKIFTKEAAARNLLDLISGLKQTDNGRFVAWDGSNVAW